jgi:hypothetical protein
MKKKNRLALYGFQELLAIDEMFKTHGFEMEQINTRGTDVKVEKNLIFIHNQDVIQEDLTAVKCHSESDSAFIETWFTLRSYNPKNFDSWEVRSETKTFKNQTWKESN